MIPRMCLYIVWARDFRLPGGTIPNAGTQIHGVNNQKMNDNLFIYESNISSAQHVYKGSLQQLPEKMVKWDKCNS